MEARETTRAYQCGAVLINPEKGRAAFADSFPKAGVDELLRRNRLWNALVGIYNETGKNLDEARRKVSLRLDGYIDTLPAMTSRREPALSTWSAPRAMTHSGIAAVEARKVEGSLVKALSG